MKKKLVTMAGTFCTMAFLMATPALAAPTGDVSGVIEQTWTSAAQQIKTVVNSVVFPALDMILVVLLFVKNCQRVYGLPQTRADGVGAYRHPVRRAHFLPDRSHLYLDHSRDLRSLRRWKEVNALVHMGLCGGYGAGSDFRLDLWKNRGVPF